jgi:hypothetical protein
MSEVEPTIQTVETILQNGNTKETHQNKGEVKVNSMPKKKRAQKSNVNQPETVADGEDIVEDLEISSDEEE